MLPSVTACTTIFPVHSLFDRAIASEKNKLQEQRFAASGPSNEAFYLFVPSNIRAWNRGKAGPAKGASEPKLINASPNP